MYKIVHSLPILIRWTRIFQVLVIQNSNMYGKRWTTKLIRKRRLRKFTFNGKKGMSSVHSLNRVWFFATPWTTAHQASLSITNSRSLLKLSLIESVMPSNHFILCHPLLLLPSIFPSIRVFSNESDLLIRWPNYWSFNFSISPSNEYSGLISFWIDWMDLLAVQGTLKSLQKHQFFSAQLSLWSNSHIHAWLLEKP